MNNTINIHLFELFSDIPILIADKLNCSIKPRFGVYRNNLTF